MRGRGDARGRDSIPLAREVNSSERVIEQLDGGSYIPGTGGEPLQRLGDIVRARGGEARASAGEESAGAKGSMGKGLLS